MAELNDDLNILINVRNDMKSSLISKGLNPSDDIRTYANEIVNISGGSGSSNKLVDGMKLAESEFINYPNYDLSDIVDMSYMFYYCRDLKNSPNINTCKATNMSYMFETCANMTNTINIINLDTSKVIDMERMFSGCKNMTSIPYFDTSNVANMNYMFGFCYNLTSVPEFNTSNVIIMDDMFAYCNRLSSASIQNIVNMCLNGVNIIHKNLSNTNEYSPLYKTPFNNSYYLNRLDELRTAGWLFN